jgi:hypothetical protein
MVIKAEKNVRIVSPGLKKKLADFRHKLGVKKAGYPDLVSWNGSDISSWDIFPKIPLVTCKVYEGNKDYAYSHHQTICRFKDKYVVSWSNGFRNEDHFGQEVHYSCSKNGVDWEPYKVLAHTDFDENGKSGTVRNNAGMFVYGEKLYAYVGVCRSDGNAGMGMNHMVSKKITLDVYVTDDLLYWKHHEDIAHGIYLFEAPRVTDGGDILCCGFDLNDWQQGLVLFWEKGADPGEKPKMIKMPRSSEGIVPEQGTWYQRSDGRIWMYLRDGSVSMRLALSWSDDGGRTWTEPLRTDFPNTYSRAFAGRLSDKRFYIAGNNYDHYLDRSNLMIAVSGDGEVFDKMHTVLNTPTTRRIDGYHKEDGFHYPNCMTADGKLFIVCSENKEDIVVAIVYEKDI